MGVSFYGNTSEDFGFSPHISVYDSVYNLELCLVFIITIPLNW